MRIALFDYKTTQNNPIGGCNRRMLAGLCQEHEFTVFATEFDNPCPQRITYVHVPAIKRPLAALFITFHILAPLYYLVHRLLHGKRFDRVQMVESNLLLGDVSYSQFCHRKYLRDYRAQIVGTGLTYRLRVLDHWLHAKAEPRVYQKVKRIVVASHGLARELTAEYPETQKKIELISNPVDLERMRRAEDFDRAAFRAGQGVGPEDLMLVFVALGHYERKGLPQLLDAMVQCGNPRLKLAVVGGSGTLTEQYRRKCQAMGLLPQVSFSGMQKDVRPFLWSADAFVLPSFYEVFPLVALEAAGSALPLIVTPINGIEEFVVDGYNGIIVQTNAQSIRAGLERFLAMDSAARQSMGQNAATSVQKYSLGAFVDRWKLFYAA